jgi:hypothetical protein
MNGLPISTSSKSNFLFSMLNVVGVALRDHSLREAIDV